jgi:transposase
MAKGKRDMALEARWRALVAKQPTSGLSLRAFCAREQLTESSSCAWRREMRWQDREQTRSLGVGDRRCADSVAGNGSGE